ncbi:hypothetical protein LJ046_05910 [Lactobacillus delbrueckii subsp. jakobsenii ZN7a-9 = DSM 26046]|uniref:hypothetical protein n=1 Tax=Lactobacillus delbrueckii TaxID=1584 RepID=UPI0003A34225|nr:hypothetical protein [Lactobacillus delbrueckii]APG73230.1 hypothetical protein LJ046_05910 [Lactobacillus delbrueckii subsp. jakobsenii ZN7a-9 = DSM 26046]KRO16238.1 hypothetical protein IV58_GL001377 [Lactobacillus delbrueckii subsp. jakobsenii ZN7a-9 = DSM 26046]TDG64180.1 hypothetical protein C5L19_000042 [Lactobacillus delbrueckii subsp. jakobsenii]
MALIFAGLTDSQESNEKILGYLKKAGLSASFALPAARVRENDVLIKDLVKSRQQLIGSGILVTEGSRLDGIAPEKALIKAKSSASGRSRSKQPAGWPWRVLSAAFSAISLMTFMMEPSKTLSSPARLGTGLIPLEAFLEQGH